MVANRGYDSVGAKTRSRLIEAAAELLGEEGYPAISARRIAAHAGLKPQLVHYYFRSMEDLMIAVFHRSTEIYMRLHDEATAAPFPLQAIWELNSRNQESRRVFEFVALTKQYPLLREEMRKTGEGFRARQIALIEKTYADRNIVDPDMSPAVLAMLMSAAARGFLMEEASSLTAGHEETRAQIIAYLARIEGPVPAETE